MIEKKVVVLGSGGVGKSAFVIDRLSLVYLECMCEKIIMTVQYVQNVFVEKYDPTIEDSYRKSVEIEGKQYMLEILDTAGTEQFESMRDLYLKNGNGFLLIFDITNNETFKVTNDIYEKIIDVKESNNFPCVFVGNKCDLEDQREVKKEDVLKYVNSLGTNVAYLEGSAKQIINVNEAFVDLVKLIEKLDTSSKKKKGGGCCVL